MRQIEKPYTPPIEGSIDLIYGGLGSGKTYKATADILRDLQEGMVVFATWPINFQGVNEFSQFASVLRGVFGLKRYYRKIDSRNFHYIPLEKMMSDEFLEDIEKMTDCALYVDEGYAARLFDSYRKTNMSARQRMAVYGTRHFNRRIVIVAQRPNAIHVSSRAMVNRFFRCERPFPGLQDLLGFRFFIATEFQDMIDETVDEEQPVSTRWYFGSRRVFNAYDSKYLRKGLPTLSEPIIEEYDVGYFERWGLLASGLRIDTSIFGSLFGAGRSLERPRRVDNTYLKSLKKGKH